MDFAYSLAHPQTLRRIPESPIRWRGVSLSTGRWDHISQSWAEVVLEEADRWGWERRALQYVGSELDLASVDPEVRDESGQLVSSMLHKAGEWGMAAVCVRPSGVLPDPDNVEPQMGALRESMRLLAGTCAEGPLLLLWVPQVGCLGEIPEEIAQILSFLPPGAGLCYEVTRTLPEEQFRQRIGHMTCKVAHEAEEAELENEMDNHLGSWYQGWVTVENLFGT